RNGGGDRRFLSHRSARPCQARPLEHLIIPMRLNSAFIFSVHKTMKSFALFAVLGLALGAIRVCGQPAAADPYEGLAKFKFGESREPLALIEAQIRKASPEQFRDIETKLLGVLKAPETTEDAKRYICRWLAVVGSSNCVAAIAP